MLYLVGLILVVFLFFYINRKMEKETKDKKINDIDNKMKDIKEKISEEES